MVRCSNICCCCSAKTGCMLAGVLALFSSIYYFAIGILGLVDVYVTSILLDIWALVVGFLCLLAGILILIAYQGRKERFVMAFVLVYGTCGCFRGVYLANALVVWVKWSQSGWRRTVEVDNGMNYNNNAMNVERTELRNYEPACISNFVFLAICMILDIWAVLAAIVWASQLGRVRRKHEAAVAAVAFEEKRRRSSFVVMSRGNQGAAAGGVGGIGASALVKPVSNAGHAAADAGAAANVHAVDAAGNNNSIRRHNEQQQHHATSPAAVTTTTPAARTYQSVGTDVMGRTPKQSSTKREMKHTATQMTPKPRKDENNNMTLSEMRQPLIGGEQVTTTTEEYTSAGDGVNDVGGTTTKRVVTTTFVREQQVLINPLSNDNAAAALAVEDVQA